MRARSGVWGKIGLALFVSLAALRFSFHERATTDVPGTDSENLPKVPGSNKTLIVYVVANTDREVESNVEFFFSNGVHQSSVHDFVIIVQVSERLRPLKHLFKLLPSNARVVYHENECFDLGSVGWLLFESGEVHVMDYKYFGWLNPSVRGPFIPSYVDLNRWPEIFTQKLTAETKLSGTVLSCSGMVHSVKGALVAPHLQSYLIFTDVIGLRVIKDSGSLDCYPYIEDTIFYGEIGASLAILNAGYNIHSSLIRYRDVDWRDKSNWRCNGEASPAVPTLFGVNDIDLLEVVFIKYKHMQKWWPTQKRAALYSSFLDGSLSIDSPLVDTVNMNRFSRDILTALAPYFDIQYYVANSRDLHVLDLGRVICHFAHDGFLEARPFRLVSSCGEREFGGDKADPGSASDFVVQHECSPRYPYSEEQMTALHRRCQFTT